MMFLILVTLHRLQTTCSLNGDENVHVSTSFRRPTLTITLINVNMTNDPHSGILESPKKSK